MKYLSVLFLILLSLSLISCTTTQTKSKLPDSFTIRFYHPSFYESSGGTSQTSSAILTFKDNMLISGNQTNTIIWGREKINTQDKVCTIDVKTLTCIFADGTVNPYPYFPIPLKKKELEKQIETMNKCELKELNKELSNCYQIIQQ